MIAYLLSNLRRIILEKKMYELPPKPKKATSFLQVAETNDYDEDDSEVGPDGMKEDDVHTIDIQNGALDEVHVHDENLIPEAKHSDDELQFGIITDEEVLKGENHHEHDNDNDYDDFKFLQMKSGRKPRAGKGNPKKKNSIMNIAYSAPRNLSLEDKNRFNIFRQGKMNDLQKSHQWTPSIREGIDMKFNKIASSHGKKNVDTFVSFLGYLRDSSHKASFNINQKEMEKYFSQDTK